MSYANLIREVLKRTPYEHEDPADIEAWMRLAHNGILDNLDKKMFKNSAITAAACALSNPDQTKELRDSYGL